MIAEITMIVKIEILVVVGPVILGMVVKSTTKISAMTYTITVEITMIVEIGVRVVRRPVILDLLVYSATKIPAMT